MAIETELSLKINEIFLSLQGEARDVGRPTVFVRLTGCPLRCHYCDTAYAFHGGERWTLAAIVRQVLSYRVKNVTVTGGEPLAQPACLELLTLLLEAGLAVSLETSGALDVAQVDRRVVKVLDLKTPSSGEMPRNRLDNLQWLGREDQVKFVIGNRQDYVWSKQMLEEYRIDQICEVLFSPVADQQDPKQLAEWILQDRLPVRFQIQLHKLLWGDQPGR